MVFSLTIQFGLSATGLDSYLSDNAKDSESPDEHLQAQLRINLLNMQLRPVVLFDGVTGLMSAVWSAPTELTSAFQVEESEQNACRLSIFNYSF